MGMTPLNLNQYGLILEELKKKDDNNTASNVELMVLDLCHRVDYLEKENNRIRSFAKKRKHS